MTPADEPTQPEPVLWARLRTHFGCDPSTLAVVEQELESYERPNLHLALQEMLAEPRRSHELTGLLTAARFDELSLARLSRIASAEQYDEGPVEYFDVALPGDRHLSCVKNGLYLVREDDAPLAMLLSDSRKPWQSGVTVEVMALDKSTAERFARELVRETRYGKAFRGQTLSLEECQRGLSVHYHRVPPIRREELILPDAVLRRVERHTSDFERHSARLRAAGRHLKRGLLLHGPPGTGKTLTAMYLVTQMPDRTNLILTGAGIDAIEAACRLARLLTPATVLLEDVDLIGTERDHQSVGANALLFELLNQMDGLADDADILFLLTSNRPEILEPALASRPGRIDQAIEIPLPDTDCRRGLFDLFGRGLRLEVDDWDALIARTEGVSGAFIRELLRKAAILAAEEDQAPELTVRDRHLEDALGELLIAGGALTQSLLGVQVAGDEADGSARSRQETVANDQVSGPGS